MTLFHGTNKNITDGTATGTFFTDDLTIALTYMEQKQGNMIYAYSNSEIHISVLFEKNWEDHYVSRCFIPIDKLTVMEVQP